MCAFCALISEILETSAGILKTQQERSMTMYVLADVEWVENDQGLISFTQIAMYRVDENWKLIRCKSQRIRPKD